MSKFWWLWGSLGILSVLSLALPAQALIPQSQLKPAVQLYREGRYQEALKQLHRLEEAHPEDARAPYYKALCQVQLGAFDKAAMLYKQVLLLYPNAPAAVYAKRGLSLLKASPDETLARLDAPPGNKSLPESSSLQEQSFSASLATETLKETNLVPLLPVTQPQENTSPAQQNPAALPSEAEVSGKPVPAERGIRPADVGLAPANLTKQQSQNVTPNQISPQQQQTTTGMSPQMMQQMMMMSMMGSGGGQGGGSNPMAWMMPMMMNPAMQGEGQAGEGMNPEVMSQMLMNSMMSGMDFGMSSKNKDE